MGVEPRQIRIALSQCLPMSHDAGDRIGVSFWMDQKCMSDRNLIVIDLLPVKSPECLHRLIDESTDRIRDRTLSVIDRSVIQGFQYCFRRIEILDMHGSRVFLSCEKMFECNSIKTSFSSLYSYSDPMCVVENGSILFSF